MDKGSFYFNRKERIGLFTILAICCIVFLVARWPYNKVNNITIEFMSSRNVPDSMQREDNFADYASLMPDEEKTVQYQKFPVDINAIDADSLKIFGFSDYAIRNLIKYREKGGKIKDITKLKSIYGVDTHFVNQNEAWFIFKQQNKLPILEKPLQAHEEKKDIIHSIDINSADSMQWVSLPQIGPYRYQKIQKLKKRLGGFTDLTQLTLEDVVPDTIFQTIEKYLNVTITEDYKININEVDYKTLISHPYFNKKYANALLNYRKQHGPFKKIDHMQRIVLFDSVFVQKIMPYFTVNQ